MAEVDRLCEPCLALLPKQPDSYCLRCGQRTVGVMNGCGYCLQALEQYADATYFAFQYAEPLTGWIVGLKFADRPEWARTLGWLLWQRLQRELRWEGVAMVLPVPLHPWRVLRRRYNQSALLARALGHHLGVPVRTDLLRRIRRTQPQTHLNALQRAANVRHAFRADPQRVAGADLLLVDDVFTTGATVHAAVQALKLAGARRVVVACLAAVSVHEAKIPEG